MPCVIWVSNLLRTHGYRLNYFGGIRIGQKITVPNKTICQADFSLKKVLSPTGTLYARIRRVSDDSIIETSPDTVNVSTLTGSYVWHSFGFDSLVNEEVRICVEYSGGDSTNYVYVGYSRNSVIIGVCTWFVPLTWYDSSTYDCTIKIYELDGLPKAPTCRTDGATKRHENDATLNGTVIDDGGEACEVWFQYGKTTSYGTDTTPQTDKETSAAVSQLIQNLAKGTTYHFRVQVKNSIGTRSGSDKQFTTTTQTRGTVKIRAYVDSEELEEVDLLVVETGKTHKIPIDLSLLPRAYTLRATYDGGTQTKEQTINVTTGANPQVNFSFSLMYKLTVLSIPIEEITFTLNGSDQTTPFEQEMPSGTYTIVMPSSIRIDNDIYSFSQWENESTNPSRTVSLTRDLTLTATFIKTAIFDPLTGLVTPVVDLIEGTGPINQRQMKDVLQEVFGDGKDISENNPLQVYDPKVEEVEAKLDSLLNVEHETEWATEPQCDEVSSLAETNLTADPIVVTFPVGSTRVRAILVASIHILNLDANTHHIAFKVQGDRDGGGYVDQLDLSASAQLGMVNLDGATDAWCGAIDVTTLVNTSGSTYSFRFVVDSDNAGMVRYITGFTLVLVYTM